MADSLGSAVLTLSVDDRQFEAGLNNAKNKAVANTQVIGSAFDGLAGTLRNLAGVAGIVGIGALTQQLVSTGQASQQAEIQLSALAGAYGEAAQAQQAVVQVQKVLGISSIEASRGFSQLYAALRGTGIGLAQLEVLYVGVTNAARLSGVGTQEAAAALLQLKQGLASGRLQGDELRSVLEQLPALAQAIATEMKVNVGALRQLGSDGKITSDIIFNAAKRLADSTVPGRTQIEQLGIAFQNLQAQAAKGFGPALTGILVDVTAGIIAFSRYLKENQELISNLGKGIVNVARTLAPFVAGVLAVRAAMNAWAIATKAVAVAQAGVLALQGPKGWALLAAAAGASAAAFYGLEQAFKGVGAATKEAKGEAEKAVAAFRNLLQNTNLNPVADPTKEQERLSALRKQSVEYQLQAAALQRQTANAQELGSVQDGVLRSTIQQRQQIEEGIAAGRDQIAKLGAAIDEARLKGISVDSAEFQKLIADQQLAAKDTRLKLIEGSTALRDAGRKLVDDLRGAVTSLAGIRSDKGGLNQFLNSQQVAQRELGTFQLLQPLFREAQSRFTALTGATAPEFTGRVGDVNNSIRQFIESVTQEFDATRNVQDTQAALAESTNSLASINQRLVAVTEALAAKDWNVAVNVTGASGAQVLGDVVGAF